MDKRMTLDEFTAPIPNRAKLITELKNKNYVSPFEGDIYGCPYAELFLNIHGNDFSKINTIVLLNDWGNRDENSNKNCYETIDQAVNYLHTYPHVKDPDDTNKFLLENGYIQGIKDGTVFIMNIIWGLRYSNKISNNAPKSAAYKSFYPFWAFVLGKILSGSKCQKIYANGANSKMDSWTFGKTLCLKDYISAWNKYAKANIEVSGINRNINVKLVNHPTAMVANVHKMPKHE